jgi:hypothetical protein
VGARGETVVRTTTHQRTPVRGGEHMKITIRRLADDETAGATALGTLSDY